MKCACGKEYKIECRYERHVKKCAEAKAAERAEHERIENRAIDAMQTEFAEFKEQEASPIFPWREATFEDFVAYRLKRPMNRIERIALRTIAAWRGRSEAFDRISEAERAAP